MINIGFFTGARSEYGLSIDLLRALHANPNFNLLIYPHGLHLLNKFGYTISEIEKDGYKIGEKILTYSENGDDKVFELTNSINKIYDTLKRSNLCAVYIVGDRIEAYAVALAAHFCKLPIFHIGGGTITEGAVDNIYRYNITNLSTIHFASSRKSFKRLLSIQMIDKNKVFFVGATAIGNLKKFQANPIPIDNYVKNLKNKDYALMTFHPVTKQKEPTSKIMDYSIKEIIIMGFDILITYPNNDEGNDKLLDIIKKWKNNKNIHVIKNLGVPGYYAAINEAKFIIGNSSSGIIEVPYFNKPVMDVGSRQKGREKDIGVLEIKPDTNSIKKVLRDGFNSGWPKIVCNEIYGDGNAVEKILSTMKKELNNSANS